MTTPSLLARLLAALFLLVLVLSKLTAVADGFGQAATVAPSDPAARLFDEAEAARAKGQLEDAIGKYQRIAAEYPASQWAARSTLEAARCLVIQGAWEPAMRLMQDVRVRFPKSVEAERALERNTILQRLRLRGLPTLRYASTALNGNTTNVRRMVDVAIDSKDRLYAIMRKSVVVFNDSGSPESTIPGEEYRALIMREDTPVLVEETGIRVARGPLVPVMVPEQNRLREVEIQAAALSGDELLIADRRTKAIHRVAIDGSYRGRVAMVDATRIAVSPQGLIAAIQNQTQSLLLISPDGAVRTVPAQLPGYHFRSPMDIAFDVLGHLYLLERDSVAIFTPSGEQLSVFNPGNAPGAFRSGAAFDIDAAGRLFIYDEDGERVLVYQ